MIDPELIARFITEEPGGSRYDGLDLHDSFGSLTWTILEIPRSMASYKFREVLKRWDFQFNFSNNMYATYVLQDIIDEEERAALVSELLNSMRDSINFREFDPSDEE